MADKKTVSKNYTASRAAAWHCPDCRHFNSLLAATCGGSVTTMVLRPSRPPCPLCGSTRGRTFFSEERVVDGDGPIHQTIATARKYRGFGCGRQYVERPQGT